MIVAIIWAVCALPAFVICARMTLREVREHRLEWTNGGAGYVRVPAPYTWDDMFIATLAGATGAMMGPALFVGLAGKQTIGRCNPDRLGRALAGESRAEKESRKAAELAAATKRIEELERELEIGR